jgi:hypothetical protein
MSAPPTDEQLREFTTLVKVTGSTVTAPATYGDTARAIRRLRATHSQQQRRNRHALARTAAQRENQRKREVAAADATQRRLKAEFLARKAAS